MNLVDLDGMIIDSDSGEIVEVPHGEDALSLAAHRLADAKGQEKQWREAGGHYQRAVLQGQELRRAVYGDVVVTRAGGTSTTFNREKYRETFEVEELTLAMWRALALAAKDVDLAQLATEHPELAAALSTFRESKPKAAYALVSRVMKVAPRPTYSTREEDDDEPS